MLLLKMRDHQRHCPRGRLDAVILWRTAKNLVDQARRQLASDLLATRSRRVIQVFDAATLQIAAVPSPDARAIDAAEIGNLLARMTCGQHQDALYAFVLSDRRCLLQQQCVYL